MTTGSLSRNAGGLFESVRALGKNLAVLGVEVGVYGLRDDYWEKDAKEWRPLRAQAFSYFGPRAVAWSPQMKLALQEAESDLLHLHGLWQFPSIATRHQWKQKKTPYLISPRGMLDQWALANSSWKKKVVAFLSENAVMRDASVLHALSQAEADAIRAYGLNQRIEVIPNGVELPEILTTEDTESTEGKKRLLFLGRIHPKKGLPGALKAWAELKSKVGSEKWENWQIVIAGWDQGRHEGELKALCGEIGLRVGSEADVVFHGPAFGDQKEQLLRRADAFILPSLSEGLPMSVLEAWAYRLPVVMTPECNLPEGFASQAALEVRNAAAGYSKWDGLSQLLDMSDSDRIEMGKRGRRLVEEKFTWPKVAAQMKALYEEILGG